MCTAITLQSIQRENFFGRTMDFSYPIEPGLYVIPRNYEWYSLITMKKILITIALSVLVKKPMVC
jgi:penicillin V acylase-like amidase (Ntn superfamily)